MDLTPLRNRGKSFPPAWSPSIMDAGLRPTGRHEDYWQGSSYMVGLFAAAYRRHLPGLCRGALADLGCGPAPLLSAYAPLVDWYCLVDWPSTFHDNRAIDLAQDLNEPLALPDATFDTIVLTSVLEHIRRPEDLMRECARILAPGGSVFVQVPFAYWLHEEPYDFFRYTRHALADMSRTVGLDVVLVEAVGDDTDVLVDILAKKLCSSRRGMVRRAGRILQSLASRRFGRPGDTDGRTRLPLGYILIARKPA